MCVGVPDLDRHLPLVPEILCQNKPLPYRRGEFPAQLSSDWTGLYSVGQGRYP
jgi:hypothetical protein